MPFDHRRILGIDPWVKPIKFDMSVTIYLFTAAVLMRLLGGLWVRQRHWIGFWIAVTGTTEDVLISVQSARGLRSHMNFDSPRDAAIFAVMGVAIVVNTVAAAWLLRLWCTRRMAVPAALAWGVRAGLATFLAGSLEGFVIVAHMGHTVGARDGGAGLPLVNWSTAHGDLRVPHFFALHALQAMVLLGWGLSRTRWPSRAQVSAVLTGSVAYMAGVWLLFEQAMAGRPVIR